jgi:hypothetical protein
MKLIEVDSKATLEDFLTLFKDVAFSRKSALLLKLRTLIAMYAKFIPIFAVESFVLFSFTQQN